PGMNMGQDRQMQMVGGNGGNQFRQYAGQNVRNLNRNQSGLIGVRGNVNQNPNGNGNLVAACAEGNASGNNRNQIRYSIMIAQKEDVGIQLQAKEFDLMAAAADLDEIEEVNENYILMANLQQASTSADESLAKHKALELEIEHLLRAVVSQDIMFVVQNNSVVETSNLQTELERVDNTKTRRPQPRSNIKNDKVPSASKSSRSKIKGVKVEEHHRKLLLSRNKKHMSSE
nr:hypothetical protein [Tanacetum cinerariifolium]GFA93651.1 hypothetical protein [Tanacetum cinerariifolium]